MIARPLRVSRGRTFLYGGAILALCLLQVRFVVAQRFGDWSAFWAAGATAGTPDLLDPARHALWQTHHHVLTTVFPYLPGAALLLLPLKNTPLALGYAINFFVMALAAAVAALAAARIYALPRALCGIATFAWAPLIAAPATGQNAPLGLLFSLAAVAGIAAGSWALAGIAVGLLLYKLTYALPFVLLLVVRKNFRALGLVCVCGALWYAASVAATAGDWHWPMHYAHAIASYAGADARFNAVKAVSIPQLLLRAGLPQAGAFAIGGALFAAALPFAARVPALKAASFVPLLGLALGPHTSPYDLALALPAIFWAIAFAQEPLRSRVICSMYVLAPLWLLSGVLHFDVLAVLCDGFVLLWLLKGLNESPTRAHIGIADSRNRCQT